jgi:ribosomal protein L11 methylase PrmA
MAKKSVRNCCKVKSDTILDIGTGDLAILMTQTNATKLLG